MDIIEALKSLDPDNVDHWTGAGLPSVDAVSAMVAGGVSRADISKVAAGFDRDAARAGGFEFEQTQVGGDDKYGDDQSSASGDDQSSIDCPFSLIEKAVAAAKDPKHARNYELQTFLRGWAIIQIPAKEVQARLDKRQSDRTER